ncbi:MAG: hypothetical protein Sw2LagTSB_03120 [Shewanella algae]
MKKVIVLSLFVFLFVGSYFLLYFNLLDFIEYIGDEKISGVKDYSPSLSLLFSAPLAFFGFIVVLYRTYQAEKQISMMMQQNVFSNHYKHKEEFIKFVERKNRKWFDDDYSYDLYSKLFRESLSGNFKIPENVREDVFHYAYDINELIMAIITHPDDGFFINDDLQFLYESILRFNVEFGAGSEVLTVENGLEKFKISLSEVNRLSGLDRNKEKTILVEIFSSSLYHYFLNLNLLNHIYKHFCNDPELVYNPFNRLADDDFDINSAANIIPYNYGDNLVRAIIVEMSGYLSNDYIKANFGIEC